MADSQSLKQIILSWLIQCGSDYTGDKGTFKVIPANYDVRRELIADLFKTLIANHGYTKEDLEMHSTKNAIIDACIPVHSKKKVNKKEWRSAVEFDYDYVLAGMFLVPILKAEKSEWDKEGKAMPETKLAELPDSVKKYANPQNILDIKQELEPKQKGTEIKELDFSKIKRDPNAIRDVDDEELLKELGLKDE